ncbi:MAG: glycosyl transferase group 1, partial [Caldilineae bacterium]
NLPIVSVAVGDVAEVIGSTEGCYLCTQTPDDMAEKIERVLNEGRRTKGRDAIQHLQTRGEAEHILALYKEVLERWRHHR